MQRSYESESTVMSEIENRIHNPARAPQLPQQWLIVPGVKSVGDYLLRNGNPQTAFLGHPFSSEVSVQMPKYGEFRLKSLMLMTRRSVIIFPRQG